MLEKQASLAAAIARVSVVLASFTILLHAQEVKYLDLTAVTARTELKYPAAISSNCEDEVPGTVEGSIRSVSVGDGAADSKDPRALGVYLERVSPTTINSAQPFEADFKVVNTGLAPIQIPVSPHLADLQTNESDLNYYSLELVVRVSGKEDGPTLTTYASVILYGAADHAGTMLELKPGEWIGVKANVKLRLWPLEPVAALFRGDFWFRSNTFRTHPGGGHTQIENIYPNDTPTPWISVHLLKPAKNRPQ
jgi:hypothetical protein